MSWRTTNIASLLLTIESGSRPKGGVSADRGDIPSLGGENILATGGVTLNGVNLVPKAFYSRMTKGHLQDGDVLINKDGAQTGKVGLYRARDAGAACINEHLFLLRGMPEQVTQEYLYYTLLSDDGQRQIRSEISGSAQPGLKSGFVKKMSTSVPVELREQSQITEVLETVDRAIEQTEALIAKQQRIKTGLMQDLLTRGIDAHGNLRSEATHEFKDSPLGRIPVEWDVAPISKYGPSGRSFLRTGPFGSDLNTKHWVEYGVPVLTIGSLGEGGIVLERELLYISEVSAQRLAAFWVAPGDIVFSRVADIGRSLVIQPEHDGWIISSNLMRITLDLERARADFLHRNIAHNSAIRNQLRTTSNSGGRDLVNGPILRGLLFPWPSVNEQNLINGSIDAVDLTIRQCQMTLEKLVATKYGLMQDLLTGKKRVTPLLELAEATE